MGLSLVTTNIDGKALNISAPVLDNIWIVDSGATNHMTFDSRHIANLKPSSQKSICTANGSEASVVGEGSLSLTETLNLDSVLVVPSLNHNLLSNSEITTSLSCVVIFWPNSCVLRTFEQSRRLVMVLSRGSCITWT
jgi:hypothetical protein